MDSSEEWTTIKGYDYFVSTYGQIENARTGELLKPNINTHGYYIVQLYKNSKGKTITIHRLVANAFLPNPENKRCIDHINNDRLDNRLENLRYATHSENGMNRSISSSNTSGIKGISWYKSINKWRALIKINGKKKHIGLYKTLEEAQKARQEYANELFGNYTNQCEKN